MTLPNATPEALGLDPKRLMKVERWLDQQLAINRLAGASIMVGRKGSVALVKASGDLQRDSIVRLYSMTKPVTTVAAMILHEQGCFQFDDPVALYLPEFADTPVWCPNSEGVDAVLSQVEPQQSLMTVHQLMTHTSGLTYGFMNKTPVDAYYREHALNFPGADESLASLVTRLAKAPLVCQPGSAWNYSVSTDVLGRLVEVWSGRTLTEFLEQEIFQPLGMNTTNFQVNADQAEKLVDLYGPAAGGELGGNQLEPMEVLRARIETAQGDGLAAPVVLESAGSSSFLKPPALLSGGGGLVGTLDDYARFCQMLLNDGELDGVRLLGRKSVEFMRCNQLPEGRDLAAMGQAVWSESSYSGIGYGLGVAVVLDPVKGQMITSPGEYHWGGAASTFFWVDPAEDLFVVFLTQLFPSSAYPLRRELRTAVYQALVS